LAWRDEKGVDEFRRKGGGNTRCYYVPGAGVVNNKPSLRALMDLVDKIIALSDEARRVLLSADEAQSKPSGTPLDELLSANFAMLNIGTNPKNFLQSLLGCGLLTRGDLGLSSMDNVSPSVPSFPAYTFNKKESKRLSGGGPPPSTPPRTKMARGDEPAEEDAMSDAEYMDVPGSMPACFHKKSVEGGTVLAAVAEWALKTADEFDAAAASDYPLNNEIDVVVKKIRGDWPANKNAGFMMPVVDDTTAAAAAATAAAASATAAAAVVELPVIVSYSDLACIVRQLMKSSSDKGCNRRRDQIKAFVKVRRDWFMEQLPESMVGRWRPGATLIEIHGGAVAGTSTWSSRPPRWKEVDPRNNQSTYTAECMLIIRHMKTKCNIPTREITPILYYTYFLFTGKFPPPGSIPSKSTIMRHLDLMSENASLRLKTELADLQNDKNFRHLVYFLIDDTELNKATRHQLDLSFYSKQHDEPVFVYVTSGGMQGKSDEVSSARDVDSAKRLGVGNPALGGGCGDHHGLSGGQLFSEKMFLDDDNPLTRFQIWDLASHLLNINSAKKRQEITGGVVRFTTTRVGVSGDEMVVTEEEMREQLQNCLPGKQRQMFVKCFKVLTTYVGDYAHKLALINKYVSEAAHGINQGLKNLDDLHPVQFAFSLHWIYSQDLSNIIAYAVWWMGHDGTPGKPRFDVLPLAAKMGRWETVGKACHTWLAVRELKSTNPLFAGQKFSSFFRWLSAAKVYQKIKLQAKRLALQDSDPRLITALTFEAEFWYNFLKDSFVWTRRKSLQGWRPGFGIFDIAGHVYWTERGWWEKAMASPEEVMTKSWAAADNIPEGQREAAKSNMKRGLAAGYAQWEKLYKDYMFGTPLVLLHLLTPGLSRASLRVVLEKIIEYRSARGDTCDDLMSIVSGDEEEEDGDQEVAYGAIRSYCGGEDSGLKLSDLWSRLGLDNPALLSSFERLASNPLGAFHNVDDKITVDFRAGTDEGTKALFDVLARSLGPLPSSDAVLELNFSRVKQLETMGQSHSATDGEAAYAANEMYHDQEDLRAVTKHWTSHNHKTDEVSKQHHRDLEKLQERIERDERGEPSTLAVRSMSGKRTLETKLRTDVAVGNVKNTIVPNPATWEEDISARALIPTSQQVGMELEADMLQMHFKVAVLLNTGVPGQKKKLFFNSSISKGAMELAMKLHLRFLWDLSTRRKDLIAQNKKKIVAADLLIWIDMFTGGASKYPKFEKEFKEKGKKSPASTAVEGEAAICGNCGLKHAGGILCFLGITSLRFCSQRNQSLNVEELERKKMSVYTTEGEVGEGVRYILNLAMSGEDGGSPLGAEVARRKAAT